MINIVSPINGVKAQYLNPENMVTQDELAFILQQLDAGVTFGDTFGIEPAPINMGVFGYVEPGGYFGVVKSF